MQQMTVFRNRLAPAALMVALLASTIPAVGAPRAQQDRQPRPGGVDRELAETLERVLILRLKKALELATEQEEVVEPLMRDLTRQRRERAHQRMEAMRTLTVLSRDMTVDESVLRDRLDRHYADQATALKEEASLLAQIRAALTPRQETRLLVFEERFRAEIRERLQDARRQRERARPRTDRPAPGTSRNR
jgi:vancomycin resistance protein YoaR